MLERQWSPKLHSALRRLIEATGDVPARIATFDADGTLWPGDANESLIAWMDVRDLLPRPEGVEEILPHYLERHAVDRQAAYIWATQLYAGLHLSDLETWAKQSFSEEPTLEIHNEMAALVRALQAANWSIYIVSASPWWAIMPGATRLGIPRRQVLAMNTQLSEGRLTSTMIPPITSGTGKVEAVRTLIGDSPALVAGNSVDDIPLLETASELALLIDPDKNTTREVDLRKLALERNWWVHSTAAA
jgi:phosphoserine phosphatase